MTGFETETQLHLKGPNPRALPVRPPLRAGQPRHCRRDRACGCEAPTHSLQTHHVPTSDQGTHSCYQGREDFAILKAAAAAYRLPMATVSGVAQRCPPTPSTQSPACQYPLLASGIPQRSHVFFWASRIFLRKRTSLSTAALAEQEPKCRPGPRYRSREQHVTDDE